MANECTILFTWKELERATNSRFSINDPMIPRVNGVSSISTDTRNLAKNTLFLALRGQRFDGHDFIGCAIRENVSAVCADKLAVEQRELLRRHQLPYLLVNDTLKALHDLAKFHRLRFKNIPIIAITGSTGKTSTKEIIGTLLNNYFQDIIFVTPGNTNNHIGVPLNLLRITSAHKAVVLELGTSSPGEIKVLTDLVLPNYAILTNTGAAHLEKLKTIEGVIEEKSQIFSRLKENNGCAVIPFALRRQPTIVTKLDGLKVTTFGHEKGADVRVTYKGGNFRRSSFLIHYRKEFEPLSITWNLTGAHQALNAAAAVGLGKLMGINDQTIVRALATCRAAKMRMEVMWKNDICWINDAYNANPESMKAFSIWLSTIAPDIVKTGVGYIVLGDMLELGKKEERYHAELLHYFSTNLREMILLPVGERMSRAAKNLGLMCFANGDDVKEWLDRKLQPGDSVALKGSRGMKLERIVPQVSLSKNPPKN